MKNIVLIGMSGCGKSTVGKILADISQMEFIDMDDELERREATSITEIFAKNGEAYFRRIEKKLAAELSQRSGLVIATGGGFAADSEERGDAFRDDDVVFLYRDFDEILKTLDKKNRPKATDDNSFFALYKKRLPGYEKRCDFKVENSGNPRDTAQMILALRKNSSNHSNFSF